MRRALGAALIVAMLAAPAFAQVTDEDLSTAEQEVVDTRAELEALAVELEAATVRSIQLEEELDRVNRSVLDTQVAAEAALELLQQRAVELYTAAASNRMSLLFFSGSPEQLGAGLSYLESLAVDDEQLVKDLESLQAEYERQLGVLGELEQEQQEVVRRLDVAAAALNDRLDDAQASYVALVEQRRIEDEERRRAEEERRRAEEAARAATSTTTTVATTTTIATATTSPGETTTTVAGSSTTTIAATTSTTVPVAGGMACPVDGFSTFTDTWGAPRSGGRSHQGVDMLAARGTPTVAIEAGTIRRMGNGGLGGITIWLTGSTGDEYYYAHLDDWAPGLSVGQSVAAGELIGYVGSTGNASYAVPHLHFEFHPGGGSAINPYPLVKGICG